VPGRCKGGAGGSACPAPKKIRLATGNWYPPSMPEISARAGNAIWLAARPSVLSARPMASNNPNRSSGAAAASIWVTARTRIPPRAARRIPSQLPNAIPAMKAAITTASCWYT